MKKYLLLLIISFVNIFCIGNVDAESVTHNTDLFGDVTFDIEEIATENNYNLTGNYILAKRNNKTDIILVLELENSNLYYDRKEEKIFAKNSNNNNVNLTIMLYDNSTKSFKHYNNYSSGFSIDKENFYYDTTNCTFYSVGINASDLEKLFISSDSLSETEKTNLTNAYNYFNIDSEKYDYVIFYRNKYLYYVYWEKELIFNSDPRLSFNDYTGNSNRIWVEFFAKPKSGTIYRKSYDLYNNTSGSSSTLNGAINIISFNINDYKLSYYSSDYRIYESSIDFKLGDTAIYDYNSTAYNPDRIKQLSVCDSDLCYLINLDNIIYEKNKTPGWTEKTPTINITKKEDVLNENNEIISKKVNINFSIFDTEKYLYFYSTSEEKNKTWIDILENDFEYVANSNGTLYVAVIDKAKYIESAENSQDLVFDYITTATYEFSGLAELIPDIKFEADVPDSCYLTISGNREIICKRLKAEILNYNDFNKYLVQYSNDGETFLNLYSTEYVNVYSENQVVYFKILNQDTNEYVKYMTYTLDGISVNMSSVGPYVRLNGEYNEKEFYYELSAYFYNYDSSLYNYYYSVDRENWTEINQSTLNVYSGSGDSAIRMRTFKIYQDCTFYLKIEDKEGNYVYSTTITIDNFSNQNSPQKFLNYLKNIFNENNNIFDKFNEVYNLIRNSKIGIFIYILIGGSLIILLIKSIKRN